MTVNEFLFWLGDFQSIILGYFILLPVLAFVAGYIYKKSIRRSQYHWFFSVIIHLVAVPGIFSITLIIYTLFFTHVNLLNVDVTLYFLPVISMFLTLYFIKQVVSFERLPGFDRLSGLMLMIGLVFVVILFLYKMRIFIGFFASMEALFGLAVILFILFKLAARKLGGKSIK